MSLPGPVIVPFGGVWPRIAPDAFVAPGVFVAGDVEIGPEAVIMPGCVIRGDVASVRIGARTNVQDATVIHVSSDDGPTVIGADVTIGHHCLVHACTLEDRSFVGMRATVMDRAVVETGAMVAAGALVTPGKRVPAGELWSGSPARLMRALTDREIARFADTVDRYVGLGRAYREAIAGL